MMLLYRGQIDTVFLIDLDLEGMRHITSRFLKKVVSFNN